MRSCDAVCFTWFCHLFLLYFVVFSSCYSFLIILCLVLVLVVRLCFLLLLAAGRCRPSAFHSLLLSLLLSWCCDSVGRSGYCCGRNQQPTAKPNPKNHNDHSEGTVKPQDNVKLKNLRKQETTLASFGTHNYELESLMSMLFAAVFALQFLRRFRGAAERRWKVKRSASQKINVSVYCLSIVFSFS